MGSFFAQVVHQLGGKGFTRRSFDDRREGGGAADSGGSWRR